MSYTDFTKMMEQASPLEQRIKRSIDDSKIPNCNSDFVVHQLATWIAEQPKTIAGSIVVEKIITEGLVDREHRSQLLWSFVRNFAKELEKLSTEDTTPLASDANSAMLTVYLEFAKQLALHSRLPSERLKTQLEGAGKILQHSVANKAITAQTLEHNFTKLEAVYRLSQLQRSINAFYYVLCEAVGPFEGDKALKQSLNAAKTIAAAIDFPPDQLL